MTTSPLRIDETATLTMALHIMQKADIRHLPVVKGGKVVGVISNRDIAGHCSKGPFDPNKTPVRFAMTVVPYTVTPETPLFEVTEKMITHKYGSVLVSDKKGLVGIFTAIDALRVLHEVCSESARYEK